MDELNAIERTYRLITGQGRKVLKLFSGNPNEHGLFFPAESLKREYGRYFDSQSYQPHPKGLASARNAVARYYARRGSRVHPEHVLLTSGSSESFFLLFSLLAKPGEHLLAPRPGYPLFDQLASLARVELRPYFLKESRGWKVDCASIENAITDRTRGILLISPHNPTGSVLDAEELRAVAGIAARHGLALVCDEVFSEFHFGAGRLPRAMDLSAGALCFTLNGISKMAALPALKLGWIAVTGRPEAVAQAVDRLEAMADAFLACNIPVQEALPEILAAPFLADYRTEVRRRRDYAVERLRACPHLSFVEPAGGFYLMARVEARLGMSEEEFVIGLMREKGVFVHPGYFYDHEDGGIRFVISFLTPTEALDAGLTALFEFVESRRKA